MIYFTADTHFDHANIIKYCNRPFSSVNEMNVEMIKRWNSKVSHNDVVYHLGDFCFGKRDGTIDSIRKFRNQLNGTIHLIIGNHDNRRDCYNSGCFESVKDLDQVRFNNQKIVICHYAMRIWNAAHHGVWQLYGHSHGTLPDIGGLTFDAGVDNFDFYPISFDEVKNIMSKRSMAMIGADDHHMSQVNA